MIGIFTIVTTMQQNETSEKYRLTEIDIAARERQQEDEKQMDSHLSAYIKEIGELFMQTSQKTKKDGAIIDPFGLAGAKTLLTIRQIDVKRRQYLVYFLYGAGFLVKDAEASIDLSGADLSRIDFGQSIANTYHLLDFRLFRVFMLGASFVGAILEDADLSWSVLSDANFSDADLLTVDFLRAQLINADLSRTHIKECNFDGADLTNAVLIESILELFVFKNTTLINVNMRSSQFDGVDFEDSDLSGADLTGTYGLESVIFTSVNLLGAKISFINTGRFPTISNSILPNGTYVFYSYDFGATDDFEAYTMNLVGQGFVGDGRCSNETDNSTTAPHLWRSSSKAGIIRCSIFNSRRNQCCFWGGKTKERISILSQIIEIEEYSRLIDIGRAQFELSALMGGAGCSVRLDFRASANLFSITRPKILPSFYISKFFTSKTSWNRSIKFNLDRTNYESETDFFNINATALIPEGAVTMIVNLLFEKHQLESQYSTCLIDDVQLTIHPQNKS